jgi:hypothetical protein
MGTRWRLTEGKVVEIGTPQKESDIDNNLRDSSRRELSLFQASDHPKLVVRLLRDQQNEMTIVETDHYCRR